jgi:1,4-alpha-glucan branching enzyme
VKRSLGADDERRTGPIKEVEWGLNEILKQTTNTEIRRKKMKIKLFKEAKPKTKPETKKVRFNLYAPEAERVFLAGDFNNWDVHNLPMKKDNKGTWETSLALPAGRYEYRFWVDEVWFDDPNAQERVENPFGGQNCVRMMS